MEKKSYFLVLIVALFFVSLNSTVFAGDSRTAAPLFSTDSFTETSRLTAGNSEMLVAQNTETPVEEDELDESLMEDYEDSETVESLADPLYYFNYAMYVFNDTLYFYALKPVARGYKAITPTSLRKGVKNVFHNLLFPVRFVNNLLQGEISDAGTEVGVFLINSTLGVLGFGQVAQNEFDLHTADEDLGQTLGSYSIGNGFYLVWPLLGPSTLRDTVGLVGDYFLTPVNYVEPWELSAGIKALDVINGTTFRIGDYEALKDAAVDPYLAIKDAYIQNRKEKVRE